MNGAAIFMSFFFVKLCFMSVSAEQDAWRPIRGSAHLLTDGFQINSGIAFDDQFIMDVADDETMAEGLHGITEDVVADGKEGQHTFLFRDSVSALLSESHSFIC